MERPRCYSGPVQRTWVVQWLAAAHDGVDLVVDVAPVGERAVECDDECCPPQLRSRDTADLADALSTVGVVAVLDELWVTLVWLEVVAVVQQHGVQRSEVADPRLGNDGTERHGFSLGSLDVRSGLSVPKIKLIIK